jgi:hypothetical protein
MTKPDWYHSIWQSLAVTLIDDGYFPVELLEQETKKRKWPGGIVADVMDALALELFTHEGCDYLRLSDKVVPIVPNRQRSQQSTAGAA